MGPRIYGLWVFSAKFNSYETLSNYYEKKLKLFQDSAAKQN